MRVLLTVRLSTEKANKAAISGTLGQTIARIVEQIHPEAAYFGEQYGQRTAFVVANLEGAHDIPAVCEPWFLAFDASITITPAMVSDDLAKAVPDIEQAAKTYGT